MKSVGEVMAIGRNFHESLQKALRGLETGLTGFDELESLAGTSDDEVEAALALPTPDRLLAVAQAMRRGFSDADIHRLSFYDPWFIARIREIVDAEEAVKIGRASCRERVGQYVSIAVGAVSLK